MPIKSSSNTNKMGSQQVLLNRMNRELKLLELEPPPGISVWTQDGKITTLEAIIMGVDKTPYKGGSFKLTVTIPNNYPFSPPKIRFVTPIYHPNIDSGGRICLDILNLPPKGSWTPALNVATTLKSIQLLMSEPNPKDPLMADINKEYMENYSLFLRKAEESTLKYAVNKSNNFYQNDEDDDDEGEGEDEDEDEEEEEVGDNEDNGNNTNNKDESDNDEENDEEDNGENDDNDDNEEEGDGEEDQRFDEITGHKRSRTENKNLNQKDNQNRKILKK